MTVNSIVGILILKTWKVLFYFESHELIAHGLTTKFPLVYEATKHGLPPGIVFDSTDLVRHIQGNTQMDITLYTNITEVEQSTIITNTNVDSKKGCTGSVNQTTTDRCICRNADTSHIK